MDPLTEVEFGFLLIPLAGFVYGAVEEWLNSTWTASEISDEDSVAHTLLYG